MTPRHSVDIQTEPRLLSNDLHHIYTFTAEHGMLDGTFSPNPGDFCIANLNVDPNFRRKGIAKALVRCALEQAVELNARAVYSGLLSRESIDVMTDVFGEDAVDIRNIGSYTPLGSPDKYNASATLWYNLK